VHAPDPFPLAWDYSGHMTADLTIIPVGGGAHLGTVLADVLREIRRQGIVYQLTGTTTCLQGSWDEITAVAKACHAIGRSHTAHIVTLIRIEDDALGGNELQASIDSVKEIAGEKINSLPPAESEDENEGAADGEEKKARPTVWAGLGMAGPV
jgi:uncharacterized protein (TIGR00106 family)